MTISHLEFPCLRIQISTKWEDRPRELLNILRQLVVIWLCCWFLTRTFRAVASFLENLFKSEDRENLTMGSMTNVTGTLTNVESTPSSRDSSPFRTELAMATSMICSPMKSSDAVVAGLGKEGAEGDAPTESCDSLIVLHRRSDPTRNLEKHPLLVPRILENLVKYLDHGNLKNARLVCPKWNDVVSPSFWKSTTVQIKFPQSQNSRKTTIYPFFTTFSRTNQHQLLGIESIHIQSLGGYGGLSMAYWMYDFGPYLRKITLSSPKASLDYSVVASALRSILLRWCPSLKELIVNEVVSDYEPFLQPECDEDEPRRVVSLDRLEIISTEPPQCYAEPLALLIMKRVLSIKKIRIEFNKETGLSVFWQWHKDTAAEKVFYNVEDLTLMNHAMCLPICHLGTAARRFKKLKRFSIGPLCSIDTKYLVDSHIMSNFLQHFRTIDELELCDVYLHAFEFPKLPNLTRLILTVDKWGNEDLKFIENFEQLKSLVVKDKWSNLPFVEVFKSGVSADRVHLNLEELSITSKGVNFEHMIQYFPNLKTLDVDLTKNDLMADLLAFSQYPNLKKLSIVVNTGTVEFYETIRSTLSNFRELETFYIKASLHNEVIPSCDMFTYGFMRMPLLKDLVLENFKEIPPVDFVRIRKTIEKKPDLRVHFKEPKL